jgi:hypothetical protein
VKSFSSIAKPLTQLTQIDQEFIWDEPQEQAPILKQSIRAQPFQLHTDWNILWLRAMLTQLDGDGQEFVVAYAN